MRREPRGVMPLYDNKQPRRTERWSEVAGTWPGGRRCLSLVPIWPQDLISRAGVCRELPRSIHARDNQHLWYKGKAIFCCGDRSAINCSLAPAADDGCCGWQRAVCPTFFETSDGGRVETGGCCLACPEAAPFAPKPDENTGTDAYE